MSNYINKYKNRPFWPLIGMFVNAYPEIITLPMTVFPEKTIKEMDMFRVRPENRKAAEMLLNRAQNKNLNIEPQMVHIDNGEKTYTWLIVKSGLMDRFKKSKQRLNLTEDEFNFWMQAGRFGFKRATEIGDYEVFMVSPQGLSGKGSDPTLFVTIYTVFVLTYLSLRESFANKYIVSTEKKDLGRKVRGVMPSGEVNTISIPWDRPTTIHGGTKATIKPGSSGIKKCLHEVKGFYRKKPSGGVCWVRPHKRGNPNEPRKNIIKYTEAKYEGRQHGG